jgi:flagellar motor switch protein FliM
MSDGFPSQDVSRADAGGLHSLLQSAAARNALSGLIADQSNFVERMPLLSFTLRKFAEDCAERLSETAFAPVQMTLASLTSQPSLESFLATSPASVSALVHASGWDAHLLFSADRHLISMVVEMLLGADGAERAPEDDRPVTKIETRLTGLFFERVSSALHDAFETVAETPFEVETASLEVDVERVARPNKPIVAAMFNLRLPDRSGTLTVVVSHAALTPMRALLGQIPKEPDDRREDPGWTEHIQSELSKTEVTLTATLDERMVTLDEISSLKVGQIIQLNATPESRIRVECAGEPMFWCHLGKASGFYTLRVDGTIDREQEFMDEITRG